MPNLKGRGGRTKDSSSAVLGTQAAGESAPVASDDADSDAPTFDTEQFIRAIRDPRVAKALQAALGADHRQADPGWH